jgi:hypothetical protein
MPNPSLADKQNFFPNVLADSGFQQNGILIGEEPSIVRHCKWVVIDADRHELRVWEKTFRTSDFVTAGQGLGASFFSNGPYFSYASSSQPGGKELGAVKYYAISGAVSLGATLNNAAVDLRNMVPFVGPTSRPKVPAWVPKVVSDGAADHYLGGTPVGAIVVKGQTKFNNKTPHLGHFGRGSGTGFASYVAGPGDPPPSCSEAIGGLLPAVTSYSIAAGEQGRASNQYLYMGLAPLQASAARFANTTLAAGLKAYATAAKAKAPVAGLIFGLFYQGNSHAQLMVDIGVENAVLLDGSDSTLFGHDNVVMWGDSMAHYKRIAQQFGFAFYKR